MYTIEQRDDQLVGTKAAITYTVSFERAPQHLVSVRMRVEGVNANQLTLVMPSWTPGSYKIRDYAGYQGNVLAWVLRGDQRTQATMKWRDKASLVIETPNAEVVEIEYLVYAHERTVRTNHVNRFHAFLVPTALFMYVEGRQNEIHHVRLSYDSTVWPSCSTALSPVSPPSRNERVLGALNYDVLADSPIEIGDHQVRTFDAAGARHEVALPTNYALDIDWLTERIKRIVTVEAELFGGVPYDRYVFVIQVYPGAGGGLEHARSSINAVDPQALLDKQKVVGLLSLLCHEYFHLWNVKRIRPVELGPFDYTRENYTPMLWLAEGLTSYYDDLLTYRCGFTTWKEYLETLSKDHIAKLASVPGRFAMSTRDSSYLAWLKLYLQSPDGNNRFPSYYLKGGVVTMMLDIYIIDHSDGKHSLDDAMRALWKRYQQNPAVGVTEEECIAIIEAGTRIQIRDRLLGWLNGTDELPYNEVFEAVGLRVIDTPKPVDPPKIGENLPFAATPAAVWCGWTLSDANGKVLVKAVDDNSPAAKAGIGLDDEILAVNGKRVVSVAQTEHYIAASGEKGATLDAHCDGRLYSTQLQPRVPPAVRLVEIDNPTKRQTEIRNVWLRRNL